MTAFSGVAANMGGVVLAFMFISLIGRQGLATKMMKWAGWDLYSGTFDLYKVPGLVTVYTYFQIPLMFLVTLPAIDGLKESWREASSNLGGTAWTYWRRVGLPVLTPSLLGGGGGHIGVAYPGVIDFKMTAGGKDMINPLPELYVQALARDPVRLERRLEQVEVEVDIDGGAGGEHLVVHREDARFGRVEIPRVERRGVGQKRANHPSQRPESGQQ